MELLVVRHAVAFERDPAKWPEDRERPLTKQGARSFRRAARGLASITEPPDVVLSSPFVRAWRTAEILHDVGWPEPQPLEALAADRGPEQAIAALVEWRSLERVAIVGHEPMLGRICRILTGYGAIELKKGAVARLGVSALEPGGATLRWLLPPKVLRRLAR
jgi:phosphohistidine phosphatase